MKIKIVQSNKIALKLCVLLCCLFSHSAFSSQKGQWEVGGKVSAVNTGEGYGVKTGIKCEYHISDMLTWRTDLDALLHGVTDLSRVDISVPSNLLLYPLSTRYIIDPYLGPGLTFVHTWNNNNTLGINGIAGVNFHMVRDKVFGVEFKYSVPLVPKPQKGNFEFGLTGAWEINF